MPALPCIQTKVARVLQQLPIFNGSRDVFTTTTIVNSYDVLLNSKAEEESKVKIGKQERCLRRLVGVNFFCIPHQCRCGTVDAHGLHATV